MVVNGATTNTMQHTIREAQRKTPIILLLIWRGIMSFGVTEILQCQGVWKNEEGVSMRRHGVVFFSMQIMPSVSFA